MEQDGHRTGVAHGEQRDADLPFLGTQSAHDVGVASDLGPPPPPIPGNGASEQLELTHLHQATVR